MTPSGVKAINATDFFRLSKILCDSEASICFGEGVLSIGFFEKKKPIFYSFNI
jgi:hypothetical protein